MYAIDYGDLRMARDEYSMILGNAAGVLEAARLSHVRNACPHGLKIDSLTVLTRPSFVWTRCV